MSKKYMCLKRYFGIVGIIVAGVLLVGCEAQKANEISEKVSKVDDASVAEADNTPVAEADDLLVAEADDTLVTESVDAVDAEATKAISDSLDADYMAKLAIPIEAVDSADWNERSIIASEAPLSAMAQQGVSEAMTNSLSIEELASLSIADGQNFVKYSKCYADEKSGFAVFAGSDETTVFMTPDKKYVTCDFSVFDVTRQMLFCDFMKYDFDADGADELGLVVRTLFGTGYEGDALMVLDKATNTGKWTMYHMTPDCYTKEILSKVKFDIDNNNIYASIDGMRIDTVVRTMTGKVSMSLEQLLYITVDEYGFCIRTIPVFFDDGDTYGMYDMGKEIQFRVNYAGDGVFTTNMNGHSMLEDGEYNVLTNELDSDVSKKGIELTAIFEKADNTRFYLKDHYSIPLASNCKYIMVTDVSENMDAEMGVETLKDWLCTEYRMALSFVIKNGEIVEVDFSS